MFIVDVGARDLDVGSKTNAGEDGNRYITAGNKKRCFVMLHLQCVHPNTQRVCPILGRNQDAVFNTPQLIFYLFYYLKQGYNEI